MELHEQNGVMGRANRLLARWATLIATGFPEVRGIPAGIAAERVYTGSPIRPAVLDAAKQLARRARRTGGDGEIRVHASEVEAHRDEVRAASGGERLARGD